MGVARRRRRPHPRLVTDNGVFRPFALVAGRAVATWGIVTRRHGGGRVRLEPLEDVAPETLDALTAAAADVERFLAGRRPGRGPG